MVYAGASYPWALPSALGKYSQELAHKTVILIGITITVISDSNLMLLKFIKINFAFETTALFAYSMMELLLTKFL